MTRAFSSWFSCLVGCSLLACAGRSLDLDQAGSAGTASVNGGPAVSATRLRHEMIDFWADDERIYFSDTYTFNLQSCVYDNCNATYVSYGSSTGPVNTTANDVFFGAATEANSYKTGLPSGILRCPKQGCGGAPENFIRTGSAAAPVTDASYFYWSSTFDIFRCRLTGCPEVPETVVRGQTSTGTIAVLGANLYWWAVTNDDTATSGQESHLYSAPIDGSAAAQQLTLTGPDPSGLIYAEPAIAVSATGLYWIEAGQKIMTCPLEGCGDRAATALVSTDTPKQKLWVDDRGLYWLDSDGFSGYQNLITGKVLFWPLAGCAAGEAPRALTPNAVRKFVLDSQYVYWNAPDGTSTADPYGVDQLIYRVAKPAN